MLNRPVGGSKKQGGRNLKIYLENHVSKVQMDKFLKKQGGRSPPSLAPLAPTALLNNSSAIIQQEILSPVEKAMPRGELDFFLYETRKTLVICYCLSSLI